MIEEWRDIVGYENKYKVSNMGKVMSLNYLRTGKQKELKQVISSSGYYVVNLCKDGKTKLFSVHRLVAIAFLPNPKKQEEVNHINENTKDNRVENLEWCDRLYNANYGTLKTRLRNIRAKNHCKTIYQYTIDKTFVAKYQSGREITRQLGFNNSYICSCCKKENGIAYGYLWSYNEIENE